jgi:hypothetical protein
MKDKVKEMPRNSFVLKNCLDGFVEVYSAPSNGTVEQSEHILSSQHTCSLWKMINEYY